jgi:hypothetical protein
MEERKRRVANELSAICGSTIFVPESVPGSAEYSESVYRELINDDRCRAKLTRKSCPQFPIVGTIRFIDSHPQSLSIQNALEIYLHGERHFPSSGNVRMSGIQFR